MFCFGTRGQVTPKSIVKSAWKSNSSEILCLSKLSASFIKFQLKLIRIYPGQSKIWSVSALTSNSKVNSPIWPEVELIQDFMHVHVICKFHKDPIKNKKAMLRIRSNIVFSVTQGQVSPTWIVWSSQNSILSEVLWLPWLPASLKMIWSKVKMLYAGQHFLHKSIGFFSFGRSRVNNSEVNIPIWPEIKLIQDFMFVLVTCMYDKGPIKMKSLSSGQGRIWVFFGTWGEVTPKRIFWFGQNSNFTEI